MLVFSDTNGRITHTIQCPEECYDRYEGYIVHAGGISPETHYVSGTDVVLMGTPPSIHHTFDYATSSWLIPGERLVLVKEQAKQGISDARNVAEVQGFTAFGKLFDSDPRAVQRISVAVQAAQAVGETFSIEWTCADNSTITLDHDQMLALPAFMADAANALHTKSRMLKAAIDAAQTLEEVESIQWN